jgi:TRAP transporter TAXI family solute receptor
VHPESITLVASEESDIREIADLRGKRVNLGNPGSGQLQNSKDVLAAVGIGEDEISAEYVKAVEAPGLLQDGRIDAFFYTVGHPAGNIKEATSGRIKVRLIPIAGPAIDEMIRNLPYYAAAIIPQEFYPTALNEEDVITVGVKATFVTSKHVSSDIVYAITKEVFENLDDFRELHPAYKVLTERNMLKGLSAPVHQGALRYYRESGLIEHVDPALITGEMG